MIMIIIMATIQQIQWSAQPYYEDTSLTSVCRFVYIVVCGIVS